MLLCLAAYKRTCLEWHPDKRLVGVTDEDEKAQIEERFKLIQEAYETLSDPARRRECVPQALPFLL